MKNICNMVLLVAILGGIEALQSSQAANNSGSAAEERLDPSRAREAAEEHLKFLYTSYFTIRGCTEASATLNNPEYKPSLDLEDAREIMRSVEMAGKEVGVDVDTAWAVASPIGEVVANTLKRDLPGNLEKCKLSGRYFRLILTRFQAAIHQLGSKRSLLKKDF